MVDTQIFQSRRTRISLTPLIDVVFILLMFFMLTSSFTRERQLELAAPVVDQAVTSESSPLRLLLSADGALATPKDPITVLSEQALLRRLEKTRSVVLQPREDTDVQDIVSAMTRLRALGVTRLSLGNVYQGG